MGCASSKLDELPAVALCRERCVFLDEAIHQCYALAEDHLAYVHSLRAVGASLHRFFDQDLTYSVAGPPSSVLNLPAKRKGDPEPSGQPPAAAAVARHSHSNSNSSEHLQFNSESDEDDDDSAVRYGIGHGSAFTAESISKNQDPAHKDMKCEADLATSPMNCNAISSRKAKDCCLCHSIISIAPKKANLRGSEKRTKATQEVLNHYVFLNSSKIPQILSADSGSAPAV
ncbi:hypothetical protein RJ640_012922 [Escallonia rubra]|uniref:DUF630 domain-containing protein n=1 Tax=Escallonia rubra TaxID=112253 RepID=A0AA88UPK4_9ASTE|nr:hypothetical protein RJ640_012922 [Escallonia rubra]